MHIICCQLDIVWENKRANHDKVRALLAAAAPPKDSLVVLPEMFATGFSMNVAGIRDDESHETQTFLAQTAAEYGVYLLGGVVTTTSTQKGRNEAVIYSPAGMEVARYCKVHPFTLGGEAQHYICGATPQLFALHGFTVAPFICYDLRFPELFRLAVRRGANLYPVIANWPSLREHHWITLLQARAIENQAYVIGVNRCGQDPTLPYSGRSLIVDPRGQIIADAGNGEGIIRAELDLTSLLKYREELPFLKDIHDDLVPAWD